MKAYTSAGRWLKHKRVLGLFAPAGDCSWLAGKPRSDSTLYAGMLAAWAIS